MRFSECGRYAKQARSNHSQRPRVSGKFTAEKEEKVSLIFYLVNCNFYVVNFEEICIELQEKFRKFVEKLRKSYRESENQISRGHRAFSCREIKQIWFDYFKHEARFSFFKSDWLRQRLKFVWGWENNAQIVEY